MPVHIVIRGVVNPNSTRCGLHPIKPVNYAPEEVHIVDWSDTLFYHCFVDIAVREYIVGEGPPLLTIAIGPYTIDRTIAEKYSAQELEERYGNQQSKVAKFEGKELVVFLTTPLTLTVESWYIKGFFTFWYVQKGDNGEYRAVSANIVYAQTEEDRQHLDMLLTDLVQEVKAAALKRNELTGGRVTDDPSTPLLVTDANYLSDFYKSAGAVYDDSEYATVLPPPVPGAIPTNEGATATSTPVPGEETTAPPAPDDAGLASTGEMPTETYSSAGGIPYWLYYDRIPTFTDILLGQGSTSAVPHLVVRGVAQPDSTRCDIYPIIVPNYVQPNADYLFDDLYHYHCFVDIGIAEYIVGAGPAKVTVSLHRESLYLSRLTDWHNHKDEYLSSWNDPASRTASTFEGKELILFLSLPGTLGVEAWVTRNSFNLWFIEQNQESELRAIALEITLAQTDEQRSKMDLPLAEMIQDIKEAAEERIKITNGRIGEESYLPSLITDANYLRDFYITVGAIYGTTEGATVPPPPVPGEDDPDTIPTDEGGAEPAEDGAGDGGWTDDPPAAPEPGNQ